MGFAFYLPAARNGSPRRALTPRESSKARLLAVRDCTEVDAGRLGLRPTELLAFGRASDDLASRRRPWTSVRALNNFHSYGVADFPWNSWKRAWIPLPPAPRRPELDG
jgi:hypothetical protein